MAFVLKFLELPPQNQIHGERVVTRWGNRDLYPVPRAEQTYTSLSYFAYWVTSGITITAWTLGSSMVAYGLTAGQACGAVLIGSVVAGIMAVLCGQAGRNFHLGYPMMGRASFGLYGSYFVIIIKSFINLIFFGSQASFGGQAFCLILSAIFPSFLRLPNTLPESAQITTKNLIGFMLYFVLFVPLIFIPPHRINRYLYPAFMVICATVAGVLGWAINANHGPGNLVAPSLALSKSDVAFRMVQGMCSVASAWTGAAVRQSDWTRFAKTRNAPLASQLTAAPVTITICALVGVLVTSATTSLYGTVMWNPLVLLQYVQTVQYSPACRAGTFFAGVGFLSSQLWVNLTQNTVSTGMDLAGLAPRYISMRRGALMLAVVGIIIQPWRFVSSANTFLTVLSSFGVFIAPITGIVVADFWVVRRQKWKIPDLYLRDGIFWYTWGLNWRAFLCFVIGAVPSMPGFGAAVSGTAIGNAAARIFQINYFVGLALGFISFVLINLISPPPGLGIMEHFAETTIEGFENPSVTADCSTDDHSKEKGPSVNNYGPSQV